MNKRIISIMLVLLMILTSVPVEAFGHQSRNVNPNKEAEAKYNVVNINGQKYKAYKISDIMPDNLVKKQSQKRAFNSGLMRTSGYVDQTETDPNKLWTLKINWETRDINFPNGTIIFPVVYDEDGEIGNEDDIELGRFEVDASHAKKGNTNERINMKVKEGINPNDYVAGAVVLAPDFIRYDLRIINNNKWNGHEVETYQFLANVSQNVMSVYKISWFDNDNSKRQEFEGRWKGSKSIETDLVGSTEDGYYTVIKDFIGRDDFYAGNKSDKPYTPVEDNKVEALKKGYKEEPINRVNLNIDDVTPVDTAGSYIRKDGVETQKGFLQLGTKYYYNITGDYRTLHEIELREELKVKFDPNGAKFDPAVKTEQAIGHSMKIGEAFGDLEAVTVPTKNQISNIPQKDNKDQEFVGWVVDEANKSLDFSDGKNADKLVNPNGYEVKENKTFYAVYAPKAQGRVAIQYVDQATTNAIDAKYHIDGQKYPDKAEGNVGEAVDINKIPQPVFYGYERTDTAIDVSGKTYQTDKVQTVEVEYKKLADIIPEKGDDGKDNPDANKPEVKNYYKKVVYKAEKVKGYLGEETKKAEQVVYYVNPVAGKKVSDATVPNVGAEKGYIVDDTNKWTYPQGITADTAITKDTASPIVIKANFKKETINKTFTKTWAAESGAKLPDSLPNVTFVLQADNKPAMNGANAIEATVTTAANETTATAEFTGLVKYNYDNTGKATTEIKYTVKEKGEANNYITLGGKTYAVTYADTGVTNTLGKEVINLTVNKVWAREDGAAKLPETKPTLTFDLYKDGTKVDGQSKTLAAGQTSVKWTGLDKYQANGTDLAVYTVREGQTANNTVELGGKLYEVKMTDMNNGVITVTNTLKKETTDVEFTKVWAAADGTTLPTSLPEVTFVLVKDGTVTTTTAKVDSTTNKAKFSGLDKYTKDGDEIKYTVKEQGEDKGAIKLGGKDYTVTYDKANNKVTNTLVKELKEVKATKTWTAANGVTALTKNPAVKLQLIADGAAVAGKEVAVDANGEANFGKLAKYQANGTTEIKYTVKEVGEANNKVTLGEREYNVTYSDLAVTNELQAKEVNVSYEFVTDKGAKITEKLVNDKKPAPTTAKEGKEVSAPTTPAVGTKVEIKKGTPEKLIGTYTFKEWKKPAKVTAGTEDIKFVGVWEYVGEFYPIGKDITVQVGETPDPKDGIENNGDAPDGTEYKFKDPIDTKTPGDKKAIVVVTIPNKEDHEHPRVEEVEITVHVKDLRCMTPAPEMNPVYDSDEYITGRGIAGAVIEVRYRDYPILRTKVDTFGEWEVYTPYPLEDEQFVYARQIKEPCDPSVWISEEIRYDYEYWRKDDKKEEPKKPVEIKKVWTPAELNARDHFSYIKGYGDNTFGPNRTITRAEVAMIFARLSINQSVSGAPQFKDVKAGDWYKTAVDIVARQGVVKGYEDGTFRPNQPITRREFAAIAARYAGNIDTWKTFRDVPPTDWAYTLINRVAGAGWINGYEDGTFRPNNNITRAEVVAIVNRMLNRTADKAYVENNLMNSSNAFVDNMRSAWYYYDIYEAAFGHSYERMMNGVDEKWNRVNGQSFEVRER
ncbi:S-layer homology domain-containing protein [Peptoniphilus sp.]|uniref:S-layer homology domain-containing protein n=1 Tax=Peptoniphilus sp. TaxID=1971214 RepID=UPI0039947D45